MTATLRLPPRSRARALEGHPWVFANELREPPAADLAGEACALRDARGHFLGSGIVNPASAIAWRRFSRELRDFDEELLHEALAAAVARRAPEPVRRLVWSESDDLPGLVVDQYEDLLVAQAATLAVDRRAGFAAEILGELLAPAEIVWRNDAPARGREGPPRGAALAARGRGRALARPDVGPQDGPLPRPALRVRARRRPRRGAPRARLLLLRRRVRAALRPGRRGERARARFLRGGGRRSEARGGAQRPRRRGRGARRERLRLLRRRARGELRPRRPRPAPLRALEAEPRARPARLQGDPPARVPAPRAGRDPRDLRLLAPRGPRCAPRRDRLRGPGRAAPRARPRGGVAAAGPPDPPRHARERVPARLRPLRRLTRSAVDVLA